MSEREDEKESRWEKFLLELGRYFPVRYDNYLAESLDQSEQDEEITVWEREDNGEGPAHLKERKPGSPQSRKPVDIESYRRRKN